MKPWKWNGKTEVVIQSKSWGRFLLKVPKDVGCLIGTAPELFRCVELTEQMLTEMLPLWSTIDSLNPGVTNYQKSFEEILGTMRLVLAKAKGARHDVR